MAKKPMKYTVTDGKLVLTLEVDETGGFVVTAPFDPDVLTQADSLEEAFENARDVIAMFKEYRAGSRKTAPSKKPPKSPAKRAKRTAV